LPFFKYSGNGNDFIILDNPSVMLRPDTIARMCNRHFGIGADGVLVLRPSDTSDFRMQIYNADGGEAEMCGNGLRCLVSYFDSVVEKPKDQYQIQTMHGRYGAFRSDEAFAIEMTEVSEINHHDLSLFKQYSHAFFVNTGVPHLVLLVPALQELDVKSKGAEYRFHRMFPKGTNVNFVEIVNQGEQQARVRTYERGVEDETFSCGTGLTACALALKEWLGWDDKIVLKTKGGRHQVVLGERILYSGEVKFCFKGEFFL
jgi:diaminopimelate epimerase